MTKAIETNNRYLITNATTTLLSNLCLDIMSDSFEGQGTDSRQSHLPIVIEAMRQDVKTFSSNTPATPKV
jgi:hypothetical protein